MLTVSESESRAIIARNMAAGRHYPGAVAKSLHFETTVMWLRELTGNDISF